MIVISAVFGAGVSLVHYATQDIMAQNDLLKRNRTIANAFNLKVEGESAEAYQQAVEEKLTLVKVERQGRAWYVYLRKHPPYDVGFVFNGIGFWDKISGLLVLNYDLSEVQEIQILDQKETPGLGARIEEPWFREQFKELDVAWEQPIDRRIIIGGGADAPNRVEAITGATQTSMALMQTLNQELQEFRALYESEAFQSRLKENSTGDGAE